VHEYCHLTQWVDKAPVYTKASKYLIALDKWIEGKNLPIEVVDAAIKGIVDLELDNEKRAVAMIRKYNLNIDKDKYIKKANAYLYFYHWMKETRRWSRSSNIPYKNKVIIDAMPITFRGSYDKLPNRFKKLYKQENI
jgi:hypothetical protein